MNTFVSLRAKSEGRSEAIYLKDCFVILFLVMTVFFAGCQTPQPKAKDSMAESISAFGTVTEGLTNQNVTQQDLKNLAVQVQKDPQVKSAVQSINQALSVQQTGVKYCPVDGQRFDSSMDECPLHHVKLKYVE
ncbi:MAG: hypothetical protein HQL15_06535 [Candidatus Omnitrophica bacterium]|nr:hypothetical protein [Candidatus Omnitrophota bacterium]